MERLEDLNCRQASGSKDASEHRGANPERTPWEAILRLNGREFCLNAVGSPVAQSPDHRLSASFLLMGCGPGTLAPSGEKAQKAQAVAAKTAPTASFNDRITFKDLIERSGIRFRSIAISYLDYSLGTAKLCSLGSDSTFCAPGYLKGTPNILYRNNGNGTFTDSSTSSNMVACCLQFAAGSVQPNG